MANSPAFQFYPDDFLGSGKVGMMTPVEVGIYILLLCLDWNENGFAYDPVLLARWCRTDEGCFKGGWVMVQRCFVEEGGRWFNPRLQAEREKQAEWRAKSRAGGIKSGAARTKGLNHPSTTLEPPYEPNGNTPTPSPTPSPNREETRRERTDYERLVAAKFNGSWHLVDGFLKGKAPNKREAWVKAIASLAMDYGEPLVAQACNDASAAPDPVRMPAALRSICAGLRESGIRAARSSTDPVNGSPRKSATGDAALIYGQIAGLVKQTQQPGQAVRRFIPRAMVAQLGDDVLRAYEAIGGAERVLAAEGDKVGFVIRDFTAALEAARA